MLRWQQNLPHTYLCPVCVIKIEFEERAGELMRKEGAKQMLPRLCTLPHTHVTLMCRFKREFEEKMDEQMRKERADATFRARAAAWEAEKADAQANRVSDALPVQSG